jgi:pimeloyl-ACP methyl ester carboxylesterase
MRFQRLALAAAVAAVTCVTVVPISAQDSSASGTRASSLKFTVCPPTTGQPAGVGCAKIKVPLDYSKPQGRKITLTISGAGSLSAEHFMVMNPGGPGASGIENTQYVYAGLPDTVRDQYAVISFDPRGVGLSTPVSCGDLSKIVKHPALPYRPQNARQERQRERQAQQIATSCGKHAKALLPHMTLANEARDLDRIRIALGKDKLDYLGYSAGSQLGATYATMFPQHTGRMVLDSVVDPTVSTYRTGSQQNPALQKRIDAMFAWTAARAKTYHLGTTRAAVGRTVTRMRKKLTAHPAGGRAGASELDDVLATSTYQRADWPNVMAIVRDYQRGKTGALLAATDQLAQQSVDPAQLAYNCTRPGWPKDWKIWHRDTVRDDKTAPALSWLNTWYSAPCAYWPAKAVRSERIGSVAVPPILLINSKDDAATPLIGARRMRATLPNSRLVIRGGGDHATYLSAKIPCLDAKVEAYWLTGKVPADSTCAAGKSAAASAVGGRRP